MAHRIIPELSPKDIARFYSKVSAPDENGCEHWTGGYFKKPAPKPSYGAFAIKAENFRANRVAYALYFQTDPGALEVCHTCDVTTCVAKVHLFLGTRKENAHDAMRKGRLASGDRHNSSLHPDRVARGDRNGARLHPESRPRGERVGNSKLKEAQVLEIRTLQGVESAVSLAGRFQVHYSLIYYIWKREVWAHI